MQQAYDGTDGSTIVLDPAEHDWIADACRAGRFAHVSGLVPSTFPRFVRVLHAFEMPDGTRARWAEVAATTGRIAHPLMDAHKIRIPAAEPIGDPFEQPYDLPIPREGVLPMPERVGLFDVLRAHLGLDAAFGFGIWEGYGDDRPRILEQARTIELPSRAYYVYEGPLVELLRFPDELNLWWARDRSFVAATDIDLTSTYVGTTEATAEALLASAMLETVEVRAGDGVSFHADTLNV